MDSEILRQLETADLDENLKRVDYLLKGSQSAQAHGLGIKLALLIAKELQEGLEVGSLSGDAIRQWNREFPESVVEEAVVMARQFLLDPAKIKSKIRQKLDNLKAESQSDEVELES
jgi:hypothetical protein